MLAEEVTPERSSVWPVLSVCACLREKGRQNATVGITAIANCGGSNGHFDLKTKVALFFWTLVLCFW